jgi:NAD(P)-dependent dehydrogenase (short-subunit alcohol dehydrogenase family)
LACDVSDIKQVEALAAHTIEKFGRIDIWVNNAGLSTPYGPTAHVPPTAFAKTISTNIIGVFNGSSVAMRYFLVQNSGKLINLLGRGDRQYIPLQNAYGSSKAWARHFTLTLAKEYQHTHIGVFAFNPGLVMTDMLSNLEAISGYEHLMQPLRIVTRLWGNPPEIPAQRAVWLASAATDGRTGLEENVLSIPFMMTGLLRESWRCITWKSTPLDEIKVETIQPAAMPPQ